MIPTLIMSAVFAINVWLLLFTWFHRTTPSFAGVRGRVRLVILVTSAIFWILASIGTIVIVFNS